MHFQEIVVAIDFSKQSVLALERASALLGGKGTVHLCHVIDSKSVGPKGDPERKKKVTHAHAELIQLAESKLPAGGAERAQFHVGVGRPVETLLATARKNKGDLIVIGSHARGNLSRVVLGSVAEELARTSEVPVLVVRELAEGEGRPDKVLIAVDDTGPARLAARAGVALAARLGASVEAIRVVDEAAIVKAQGGKKAGFPVNDVPAALAKAAHLGLSDELLTVLGPKARVRYATGEPGPTIARLATAQDVVVCGTHGRSGLGRLAFGSVATKLIRTVPCPILVVRPPKKAAAAGRTAARAKAKAK